MPARLLKIIFKHGFSWWVGLVSSGGLAWVIAVYADLRIRLIALVPGLDPVLPADFGFGFAALIALAWVIVTLAFQIDRSNTTRPRIFFGEPLRWNSPLWKEVEHTTMLVPQASFASTVITNEPISKGKEGIVEKSYCIAEFFNEAGDPVCTVRHARWHEGEKPRKDFFPDNQKARFFSRMNFLTLMPNANPEQIDFALKNVSKADFHGFPASAQDLYPESDPSSTWQDPAHKMPPGKYRVVLTVMGNEINAPYPRQTLFVENRGIGHELIVTWPEYEEARNWFGTG